MTEREEDLLEYDDEELDTDYDGDQEDLAARRSLRRVAGMRTELEDITEVEYRELRLERVVLVSVWTTGTQEDADTAMAELKLLAETAGSEVLDALVQRRSNPDPATYIGRGKVEEVAEVVRATAIRVSPRPSRRSWLMARPSGPFLRPSCPKARPPENPPVSE